MLKIIVRSRSDASAVKHALAKLYGTEGYEVISLGGLRGSRLLEALCKELSKRDAYIVALLGREDIAGDAVCPHMSPLAAIVVINKRKVRNAQQHEIISAVNTGKSIIRSTVTWDPGQQVYRVGKCEGCRDLPYPKGEVSDPFLIYGDGVRKLSKVLGKEVRGSLLLVRRWAGEHIVFVKEEPAFRIRFSDDLDQPVTVLEERKAEVDYLEGVDLTKVIESNKEVMKVMKEISVRYLRSLSEDPDNVVVPVSGGKDSVASLALAVDAFGGKNITAVYVNTEVDFTSNREVVEKLTKELSVRLVTMEATVGHFSA